MLEVVLKVFSVGGPAALALMGFVVIDKPPKSNRARAIWYTAFSVLAFLSVVAAIFYSEEQEERIAAMILGGGDNFPEIYGMYRSDGKIELMIANSKGFAPIYDVNFTIAKALAGGAVASRNWGTVQNFAYDTGIAIDQGAYQIDFSARNGIFIEMFYYGMCDGKVIQVSSIAKPFEGGRVMQESATYKHCMGIALGIPFLDQPEQEDVTGGIGIPP